MEIIISPTLIQASSAGHELFFPFISDSLTTMMPSVSIFIPNGCPQGTTFLTEALTFKALSVFAENLLL